MQDVTETLLELDAVACPGRNDYVLMRPIAFGIGIALDGPNNRVIQDIVGMETMILLACPDVPSKVDADAPIMREHNGLGSSMEVRDGAIRVMIDGVQEE